MDRKPSLITALITPFLDGQVDIEGLKTNIAFQLENGIEGILVLGTTGESPTLSRDERRDVIRETVKMAKNQATIFVGTGTHSTEKTIELTSEADALGADIALVVTPYYNCPMQEGIYNHFSAISHATKIPLCVYNHPKRTGSNINVETLKKIAGLPRVIGIKEASGDFNQIAQIKIETSSDDFTVWSGDDSLSLPTISLGCQGVFSVAGNIIPREMKEMIDSAAIGNFGRARSYYYDLLPLFHALCAEINPIPIKAAMEICNMPSGPCRLPLGKMSAENQEKLRQTIERIISGTSKPQYCKA